MASAIFIAQMLSARKFYNEIYSQRKGVRLFRLEWRVIFRINLKEEIMDEGTVRMAAQMYALMAEMEAVKVEIEAMRWENGTRLSRGESMAYPEGELMPPNLKKTNKNGILKYLYMN